VGGTGLLILRNPLSARTYAANEKLSVALIGAGGRGKELVGGLARMENLVALCDVNESKAAGVYKEYPGVPTFHDFRLMLDRLGSQIDAVVVATPDHTHAVAAVAAMKAGKHVFCEKPLTRTVAEAREMRGEAARQGVATQMGNQGSSSGQFRRGVELIGEGILGEVREVFVYKDGGGPDHPALPDGSRRVPDYLQWDLWLGPAAWREFHPQWLGWVSWRDFGTGQLGLWGSHSHYLAFTALNVGSLWAMPPENAPRLRVEAEVSGRNRLSFPRWEVIRFRVPVRRALPPIEIAWVNGQAPGWRARIEERLGRKLDWGDTGEKQWKDHAGALIVGTKGVMDITGHNATFALTPAADFAGVQTTEPQSLDRSQGHERDWLLACRGGKPTLSAFERTGPYSELLALGNVATQVEGELEYDPLAGRITNQAEADELLRPPYRDGWRL
jgi:hypothetical protein